MRILGPSPAPQPCLGGNLLQARAYLEGLKQFMRALPTRTLTGSIALDEGARRIELLLEVPVRPVPRPHRPQRGGRSPESRRGRMRLRFVAG
jgi:hypothetical protein